MWQVLTPSLYSFELILSSFYPPFMFHTSLRNLTGLDENRSGLLVTNRSLWSVVSLAMDYWLLDILPQDKVKPASHTEHNMCLCTWPNAWNNNLKKMTKNYIICIDKYLTNIKRTLASIDIYTEQNYKRFYKCFCPHFSWAELKNLGLFLWTQKVDLSQILFTNLSKSVLVSTYLPR